MRHSPSLDPGLIWTAVGGAALGLGVAVIALNLVPRSDSDGTQAEVIFERPEVRVPADVSEPAASFYETATITGGPTSVEATCPGEERSFLRLFEDAQVRPTYQNRVLLGVQVFGIKQASFWEALGIRTGDLITEMNHEMIDSPEASVDLLNYVGKSPTVHLTIRALDGRDRQINWQAPPAPDPATLSARCRP